MASPLDTLLTSTSGVAAAWADASPAFGAAPPDARTALAGMTDAGLLRVTEAVALQFRSSGSVLSACAAEVADRSRPELGPERLSARWGSSSPAHLIATITGDSSRDASRLIAVGTATAPRVTFTGELLPSRHPHVGAAISDGLISIAAAAAIIGMLDRVAPRADPTDLDLAEAALVGHAGTLPVDSLHRVITKTAAYLDPDGVQPTEDELRARRSLTISTDPSGAIAIRVLFDPATGSPVVAAIEAIVSAELRTARDAYGSASAQSECHCGRAATADATADAAGGAEDGSPARATGDRSDDGTDDDSPRDGEPCSCTDPAFSEERTISQMRADALADLARHAIGCEELPAANTTVEVTVTHEELTTGLGIAQIEGIDQPISASTARCLAAAADIIPIVLGGASEVLDLGRTKRAFSRAQRRALAHRDGGCAFPGCTRPPTLTQAHHILWWVRDDGPSNLNNGILLCSFHHHVIHRDGWTIQIRDNRSWFLPPPHIDTDQRPRPGNRAIRSLQSLRSLPGAGAPPGPPGEIAA